MRIFAPCILLSFFAIFSAPGKAETADCVETPEVLAETRLGGLAEFWFGSPSYRYAILLATNARVSDKRFAFITNPNELPTGTDAKPNHVCIPRIYEAESLKLRFEGYLQAVHDMALAEPVEVVNTLDPVPATGPVTVVSWIRQDQLKNFPGNTGDTVIAAGDMWVTLAPHLQKFCQDFTSLRSANPQRTVLRLEQRLGLPPAASKTHFLELQIATPTDGESLFRPCSDPDVTSTSCALGGPLECAPRDELCRARADFFYRQYYSAYGTKLPVEYPWTSLGYTFDWAQKATGKGGRFDFVRVGESEYVVPKGTRMTLVDIKSTAQYCSVPGKS